MAQAEEPKVQSPTAAEPEHYSRVADVIHTSYYYRPDGPLMKWLLECALAHLDLRPGMSLADVGAGTGVFTSLVKQAVPGVSVSMAEPSAAMMKQCPDQSIEQLEGDCAQFVESGRTFDRLVLKEMIHHLGPPVAGSPTESLYRGLKCTLRPGGRLVVLTRPQRPEYPLFRSALDTWAAGQPQAKDIGALFERAGFTVDIREERFPVSIPREQWFDMVRHRVWSIFHHLSDAEIAEGVREISAAHPEEDIKFDEVFIIIVASVPS
eukprot:TRINITY_DN27003_c0_g1_i1.p1 TRINITY_DN27003_c0_g1~~TRINITY_DN27003_c0_g1_i1.p1  ORF type:complete len:294 (+),score=67.03 TRINITY_DN27003_c0_g1_i1:89-883(+)